MSQARQRAAKGNVSPSRVKSPKASLKDLKKTPVSPPLKKQI
jgi:hypothetical protein